jgi:ABC-2 type transport system permease protein
MSGTAVAGRRAVEADRPGTARLLLSQLRYALTDLWRTRIVLIFTFAIPLVWLVVIGLLAGNAWVDEATGVRVVQFVTPNAAAMGVIYAAFPTVAISLSEARDRGILKRVRGTPLPAWTHLAGRVGGAVVFAVGSVLTMVGFGVVAYDVQVVSRTLLATLVTLTLGIACFAAIGTAVAAVSPSTTVAQAASIAGAVVLTFISGLFSFGGQMPAWISTVADLLPLKPFADALKDQFNPFLSGAGWDGRALAVLAAWTVAAAVLAARAFRWEAPTRASRIAPVTRTRAQTVPLHVTAGHRPTALSLVLDQTLAANLSTWRDAGSVFFSIVMPVGVFAFMLSTQGPDLILASGMPFVTHMAASMVAWGTAVAVFMNLPESVAFARDRAVLKRLRGTQLRPWQYLAGRTAVGLWVAVLVAAAVLTTGRVFYHLALSPGALGLGLAVLILSALTLTACGFVLVAVTSDAKAIGAIGLVILLPLAFFSDVFIAGGPAWMGTVGSFFPLKHAQNALMEALDPAGPSVAWMHLGVLAVWLVGASLVAVRFFRWDARSHG